jgi:integrase/recombinase XerD
MSTCVTRRSLRQDIDSFIAFKRRLGFVYKSGEASLRRFQRFVEPLLRSGAISLKTVTDKYTAEAGKAACPGFAVDVARVRHLCLYRQRRNPGAYTPEPFCGARRHKFLPYLLSDDEVRKTLIAARRYSGVGPRCSGETAYLLVLICYCTGLRIGEAVRLQLEDVDTTARIFRIHDSKRKSRFVPFGPDLAQKLDRYLHKRRTWARSHPEAGHLLLDLKGKPLGYERARRLLALLWRQLGIKPPRGYSGPRPTDLRHAFARGRLGAWYRKGMDLNAQLPWLSAYMGHTTLRCTEVYLHTTPELMQAVSRRFEQRFKQTGSP